MTKQPGSPAEIAENRPEMAPSSPNSQPGGVNPVAAIHGRIEKIVQARAQRLADIERRVQQELMQFDVAIMELQGLLTQLGAPPVPVNLSRELPTVQRMQQRTARDAREQTLQSIEPQNILARRLGKQPMPPGNGDFTEA